MMTLAIIGAGAAGCFCAVEVKRRHPDWDVVVLEASKAPMLKLSVTGGGRCNLTNTFNRVDKLSDVYPRGEHLMKRAFGHFNNRDLMAWFENEGVRLVVQEDQCVFPQSQDAMQIVRTLSSLMRKHGVSLRCESRVEKIIPSEEGYELRLRSGESICADRLVLTAGGNSRKRLQSILPEDIEVTETVPSLFTFRIADSGLRSLMGAVVKDAVLSLAGTRFRAQADLLLTDWGVSGPACLKLSSYAARYLAEREYKADLIINWVDWKDAEALDWIAETVELNPKKQLTSIHPPGLSERLWRHIINKSGVKPELRWAELGQKFRNKLVVAMTADCYRIDGRAAFKEEFVTCGGVALSEVNMKTLESKKHPGLYFAGEVLDVDALTGGFNLQAAWSMAKLVADSIL